MFSVTIISLCSLFVVGQTSVTNQQIAIPSYIWPTGQGANLWKQIEQGSQVGIAVINPNSGPGTSKDNDFAKVVEATSKAGKKVIGYVDTGYFGQLSSDRRKTRSGETSATAWTTQVKQDIDEYYNYYGASGLSGIFLDDALNECGADNKNVKLYQEIHDYIKSKHSGGFVVANPGTGVQQCYASTADVLVVFEHDYQAYQSWQQPSWSQNQANGKQFWHLVYGVKSETEMENVMKLSRQKNAGYVYVTDDSLPNPWDSLPSYWAQELKHTS